MVSAHCWMRAYSVKSAPQTPSGHVRYLKREGEFAPATYAERTSKKTKDYGDFVKGDIRNFPAWAGKDASYFFTQAAQHERHNGYYAFQVQFSLPRELTDDQQMALAHDFMDATMPDLPALWVKHEKRLENGEMHPHIHILFSARKQDDIERSPEQMFKRWNRQHPERGGCEKDLFWSQRHAPEQLRHAFADLTNYHLERAHARERLDARSLKRRGSKRGAIGRSEDRAPSPARLAREQEHAQMSWEQRKAYRELGDVQAIPREEFVLLVRQWTRDYERGRELPRSTPEVVEAWHAKEAHKRAQEIAQREAHIQTLEDALDGKEVPMGQLMAALAARHEDSPRGGGVRMSLHPREDGYGR